MKIVSWNVNSIRVRLPQLLSWLEVHQPDVMCLQETKVVNDDFPQREIEAAGYHVLANGQKTYNGVAILSRIEPHAVQMDFDGIDGEQRRLLAATIQGVRIINAYVPNGSEIGTDKYAYKLGWLGGLSRLIARELESYPDLVLLGDFNIAPEDRDVYDPHKWKDVVLVSAPERQALKVLFDLGLVDVFRRFPQEDQSFSWWDYRAAAFRRNHGLRIDLILASTPLAARCLECKIDAAPRSLERPSDHAPVFAEFGGR